MKNIPLRCLLKPIAVSLLLSAPLPAQAGRSPARPSSGSWSATTNTCVPLPTGVAQTNRRRSDCGQVVINSDAQSSGQRAGSAMTLGLSPGWLSRTGDACILLPAAAARTHRADPDCSQFFASEFQPAQGALPSGMSQGSVQEVPWAYLYAALAVGTLNLLGLAYLFYLAIQTRGGSEALKRALSDIEARVAAAEMGKTQSGPAAGARGMDPHVPGERNEPNRDLGPIVEDLGVKESLSAEGRHSVDYRIASQVADLMNAVVNHLTKLDPNENGTLPTANGEDAARHVAEENPRWSRDAVDMLLKALKDLVRDTEQRSELKFNARIAKLEALNADLNSLVSRMGRDIDYLRKALNRTSASTTQSATIVAADPEIIDVFTAALNQGPAKARERIARLTRSLGANATSNDLVEALFTNDDDGLPPLRRRGQTTGRWEIMWFDSELTMDRLGDWVRQQGYDLIRARPDDFVSIEQHQVTGIAKGQHAQGVITALMRPGLMRLNDRLVIRKADVATSD